MILWIRYGDGVEYKYGGSGVRLKNRSSIKL